MRNVHSARESAGLTDMREPDTAAAGRGCGSQEPAFTSGRNPVSAAQRGRALYSLSAVIWAASSARIMR